MPDSTAEAEPTRAPMTVFERFVGVITAPRATFAHVASRPTWLGMLLLTSLIIGAGAALPLVSAAGQQAALDKQVEMMEAWTDNPVTDQQYEAMRHQVAWAPYTTGIGAFIFTGIAAAIVAGILFAVFNAALGGDARYKQVFAIVVHAGAISALGQLFTGPLNYFRGSVESATSAAVLLPMIDNETFFGRLLGTIDLFIIWWLLVLAMGVAVLYRLRTQPIAVAFFAIYGCIALGIAAFMSR